MKKVLIINHYATPPSMGGLTRHYFLAKYLGKKGYDVSIMAASAIHNSNINLNTESLYKTNKIDDVTYIHVKTCQYKSKIKRIINMLQFYFRSKKAIKKIGKPDIIYASSPQPLSALLGIKIAKKYKIPCIVEIRDLWPETIVSFNILSKNNIITKVLFRLEKYLYVNASKLVFTMEGGKDYVKKQKYANQIDMSKIYHINNGTDLEKFCQDFKEFKIDDKDLNSNKFKIVYTGSIRQAYNIKRLVEVAESFKEYKDIIFLIFGKGPYKEELETYCKENKINNIVFKGFVDSKYIPDILSKCDVGLMHGEVGDVFKYGTSTNKSFSYLAAGLPIISIHSNKYDLIAKNGCGITIKKPSVEEYKKAILKFYKMDKKKYQELSKNCTSLSKKYDYKVLTDKLIEIMEEK